MHILTIRICRCKLKTDPSFSPELSSD